MPFIIGATRPMAAFAATAASIALPPLSSIAVPARAAIGCSAATIPYCEITMERPWMRSCAIAGEADATVMSAPASAIRHACMSIPLIVIDCA